MLVTGDLHLTDKKTDRYRFDLFDWLMSDGVKFGGGEGLVILGDLTDKKDHHSSYLVNQVVTKISNLTSVFGSVIILQGNHDLVSEQSEAPPYFNFLNQLHGVDFFCEPALIGPYLFLPHRRDFMTMWQGIVQGGYLKSTEVVFMHQTVHGSVSESGQQLDGVPPSLFAFDQFDGPIVSGDVHVPQKVGKVQYTGSPYPIRFGDTFTPQLLRVDTFVDGVDITPVYPPSIRKHSLTINSVEDLAHVEASKGDQMKLTYILDPSEFEEWPQYRKEVRDWAHTHGVTLHGVEFVLPETEQQKVARSGGGEMVAVSTPNSVIDRYAEREGISDELLNYGKEFL